MTNPVKAQTLSATQSTHTAQFGVVKKIALAVCLGVASTAAVQSFAEDTSIQTKIEQMSEDTKTYFNNGLREGKIETALLFNDNLNNFDIDIEVNGNKALLRGDVPGGVEKELAEEIALSVDGIDEVDNLLMISEKARDKPMSKDDDSFLSAVEDASISAQVKMKLLANEFVDGVDISVDTNKNVVTLEGKVKTEAEKDLAQQLVENMESVSSVENRIEVRKS
ncbi:MAG: BON domain-containing protein [Pseudomonadota bacterium]|nr:BON domain-containing protein [Pseudomonadota bacterium]